MELNNERIVYFWISVLKIQHELIIFYLYVVKYADTSLNC